MCALERHRGRRPSRPPSGQVHDAKRLRLWRGSKHTYTVSGRARGVGRCDRLRIRRAASQGAARQRNLRGGGERGARGGGGWRPWILYLLAGNTLIGSLLPSSSAPSSTRTGRSRSPSRPSSSGASRCRRSRPARVSWRRPPRSLLAAWRSVAGAGRMFTPAGPVLFTSYYQRARQLHGPALLPLLRHSLRCCAPHASGGSASGTVELGPSEAGETDPGC